MRRRLITRSNFPRLGSGNGAYAAKAMPPVPFYVLAHVRMSLWAMRLLGIDCGKSNAPQNIGPIRDGFQMGRIYTNPHTAEMVKCQAFWNRANKQHIGRSVRWHHSCFIPSEMPISIWGLMPFPYPTAIVTTLANLFHQSFKSGTFNETPASIPNFHRFTLHRRNYAQYSMGRQ